MPGNQILQMDLFANKIIILFLSFLKKTPTLLALHTQLQLPPCYRAVETPWDFPTLWTILVVSRPAGTS